MWYDETTDILKIRNADNDAWISIAEFDQTADTWLPYVGADALVRHATAAWEAGTATEPGVPSPAQIAAAIAALASTNFSSVAEDIIPDADSTRDIGSTSNRWAQGWFDDVTSTNTSDGTLSIPTTYVTNGSAKAWVNFNGAGTIAARDSFNVSSLTDNGTGIYTINYSNAFASADYSFLGSGRSLSAGAIEILGLNDTSASPTASTTRVGFKRADLNSFIDGTYAFAGVFGDLA
jgi:hypothetical protein